MSFDDLNDFSGDIKQIWLERYEKNIKKYPSLKHVYAAIDIISQSQLPVQYTLVLYVAYYLKYKSLPQFSTTSYNGYFKYLYFPIVLLKTVLILPLNIYGFVKMQFNLDRLRNYEIPYRPDHFIPYDGQVDYLGEDFYNTEIAISLMSKRNDNEIRLTIANRLMVLLRPKFIDIYEDIGYRFELEDNPLSLFSGSSRIEILDTIEIIPIYGMLHLQTEGALQCHYDMRQNVSRRIGSSI